MEKVIEQLAYNQFKHFIDINQILGQNQSGFRAGHSCESAINDVLFEWRDAQNKSKIIIAIFLDLQRAFETLAIHLLIHKLKKYGVHDNALN